MLTVHLLGRPRLERDGEALPGPRGHKSWALLARVLRSPDPVSRQTLVDELFSEADDPMGALRWTLAELRRRLDLPEALTGNPLRSDLGEGVAVDIDSAAQGVFDGAPPEGRFLEGINIRDSATFDTWMLVERQRVDGQVSAGIREATVRALARADADIAVDFARVMVRRDPLEDSPHVLLVKALAASGDTAAADKQVEISTALLNRELGFAPTRALRDAARPRIAAPATGVSALATAKTLRSAGLAALSAGVADAGIECLRGAVVASEAAGDSALNAECLLELGTAYVHSVHSHDDEGAVALRAAVSKAEEAGHQAVACGALAELGYVDLLAGRRLVASSHLARAREAAGDDLGLLATVASFEGTNLHDWGHLEEAEERFRVSIDSARRAGKPRREAWALGIGARTLCVGGQYQEAAEWARLSNEISDAERWTAFRPWAEAWAAHADLALGVDPDEIRVRMESTFALSCQIGDVCWEGMSAQTMAVAFRMQGELGLAAEWLRTARTSCERVTDSYTWVNTEVALTEAEVARESGDRALSRQLAERVVKDAASYSMDGMLERASALFETVR